MSDTDVDHAAPVETENPGTTDAKADTSTPEENTAEPRKSQPDPDADIAKRGTAERIPLLSRIRRSRLTLRTAAAVAVGASLGAAVFFYTQNQHNKDLLAAHEDARSAACAYAPVLANYDSKNLDPYFTAVLAGATGDWKQQFDSTSKELRQVLAQGEVVSKVVDVQCAIRTGDEHSAEAIVVIGQTITSLGTQGKPTPGQLSMVMRLEKSGDRWLVNKMDSPLAIRPQS